VFAPISAICSLLIFASTLPNGIRLVELPPAGNLVEITAGYTSGGLTGFSSTNAAKSLLRDAYATGSKIEFINELDRTGLRITSPDWALAMLANRLPALFQKEGETPKGIEGADPSVPDFKARVEEEIRSALLGAAPPSLHYATDAAFVVISASVPASVRDSLAGIPRRTATTEAFQPVNRLPAERTLRFKSDLPVAGVIFASPLPPVYYKQWYSMLLLDRLIHRIVKLPLNTALPLTATPYYYRIEFAIPSGQFPDQAEENLLQELQRILFGLIGKLS